ncbi:MAG: UDP-glucose 4-epimerase GalE [Flavobacteriales bacterium]|nr:UDP-glucose 4-epimerase GalE [Flavobacteriales bacterium]
MSKKVIVTGGAGFIGSHTVVELAVAGYEPVIIDDLRNSEERALEGIAAILGQAPTIHRIDCNDAEAMRRMLKQEGAVLGAIHFAADKAVGESVTDPAKYYRNNIGSLAVLLGLLREHGVHDLVFSSSCTVYGEPASLPVDETAPDANATSPYGFTKVACERLVRDQCTAVPSLKAVLLRYFNPIGAHPSSLIGELPRGVPNNLVPYVAQTAAGVREKLRVNGDDYDTVDGTCIRDYIHVVDLAQAHVRALQWMSERQAPLCEVFNLGTGAGNSVLEVVRTFEQVNGVKVPFEVGPRRAGDVVSVYADTRRSWEVLGWRTQRSLADALRDAWRWQQGL